MGWLSIPGPDTNNFTSFKLLNHLATESRSFSAYSPKKILTCWALCFVPFAAVSIQMACADAKNTDKSKAPLNRIFFMLFFACKGVRMQHAGDARSGILFTE